MGSETPGQRAQRNIAGVTKVLLAARKRHAKELAGHLGMSEGSLSDRIAGRTRFTADEVADIADFLDVSPGLLYMDPADVISHNVHCPPSQGALLLPNDEPAFNFGRSIVGVFGLAS